MNHPETLTISIPEAARMLGIGRNTAYEAVRQGLFPVQPIKVGRLYRIPLAGMEQLLLIAA
jgi:excisionase family DNA binding protein